MAKQITVELFTQELFALFDETFEKVQGIYLDRGTSLFETLATISAEEASRPVSANCACLAAQVEHTRFYMEVLRSYIEGKVPDKVDWGKSWELRHVTPEEWEMLKGRLRETYQEILTLLKGLETWEGEDEVGGAMAIVVHTAYHLGEIRQALCTLKV